MLDTDGAQIRCVACNQAYPIVDGIPVLINEENSLFSKDDFLSHRDTYFEQPKGDSARRRLRPPSLSRNLVSTQNYRRLAELLLSRSDSPRVLVVGGSVLGAGIEELLSHGAMELMETDVSFGPRTMVICDAHDIPFADGSFHGVIAQAVLEHVVNPFRCAEEFLRVLKPEGYVYAETPFMQQVHGGRYDFMRFTDLGHRRLFRRFEELASGVVGGPGMALAWSYRYFLLSFARSRRGRKVADILSRLTAFWLKYFDAFLVSKPGSVDAASGFYFLGRRSDQTRSDEELLATYRGSTT